MHGRTYDSSHNATIRRLHSLGMENAPHPHRGQLYFRNYYISLAFLSIYIFFVFTQIVHFSVIKPLIDWVEFFILNNFFAFLFKKIGINQHAYNCFNHKKLGKILENYYCSVKGMQYLLFMISSKLKPKKLIIHNSGINNGIKNICY